jgi:DNA-binding CsgD family transcriptional regulator
MHQAGVGADRIASHLLLIDPAGESWVAETLHEAARRAFAQGAMAATRELAARALAEPPPAQLRGAILTLLARAEMLTGQQVAIEHLRTAVEHETSSEERRNLALDLVGLIGSRHHHLVVDGQTARARGPELLGSLRSALGPDDAPVASFLDAILLYPLRAGLVNEAMREIRPRLYALLDCNQTLRGWPTAFLAYEAQRDGAEAAAVAVQHALEALAVGGLRADSMGWALAVDTLIVCDAVADSARAIEAALRDARRRGSELGFISASTLQAKQELARGNLRDAEQVARAGLEVASRWDEINMLVMDLGGALVIALAQLGELEQADEALAWVSRLVVQATGNPDDPVERDNQLRYARGKLRLVRGDAAGAAEDFLKVGRENIGWGIPNPAHCEWRSSVVPALVATERRAEAGRLAHENLDLARRFRAVGSIGRGLHALGQAVEGAARLEVLEEAVRTLEQTPLRLDLAAAHVDLGVALRHAKARTRAREVLRRGLDLAERCRAAPLAERARQELRIAGAKPRREALRGVESLTASELRVARLAAEGRSNREIAQNLFVTMRTVAFHLSNIYGKLGVTGREQLGEALETPREG